MRCTIVPLGVVLASFCLTPTLAFAQDEQPVDADEDLRIDLLELARQKAAEEEAADTQYRPELTAEEVIELADGTYGPPKPKPCPKPKDGEIVVCGKRDTDYSEFRVKSNTELGVKDNDGLPRAEDIAGIAGPGIFTGKPTFSGVCGIGLNPCPGEVMLIDLDAIPEAPAGSDAERIGNGEKRVD